jgi:site-specific DNA recombinase
MKRNAVIYARVSSIKQKEGENVQSQIAALGDYAQKNDYAIPSGWIFADEGISGSILQRPALDSLRELVQEGFVDTVLVYSPDRLSRKYAHQLLLEMEFQKQGAELVFLNTPKTKNPEEQLSLHFKSIFAEYEQAQIVERCRRGRVHRAKQGSVSVIATAPLGYDYISKTATSQPQYVINKDAQTVKKIFSYYTDKHISISKICRELEKEGILTPRGRKKWCTTTVRDILKNEAYIGTAYFGKTQVSDGVEGRIYRTPKGEKRSRAVSASKQCPRELWIPIRVPQIISESDFEVAQSKLSENIKTSSRNTKEPSILQGLLVCGHCGGSYYKKVRSRKYAYYVCGRHIRGEGCSAPSIRQKALDDIAWEHVTSLLKDPRMLETEMLRRAQEPDYAKTKLAIKDLDKELIRISKARDKLLDAYQEGETLTLKELKKRLQGLNMKYKAVTKERQSLDTLKNQENKIENMRRNIESLRLQIEDSKKLSVVSKQNVLRLLVDEIIITDNNIDIRHCIPCHDTNSATFSPLCSDGYLSPSGYFLVPISLVNIEIG